MTSYVFKKFFFFLYPNVALDIMCVSSLQSCPTLSDPMDGSPPGTSVHGILQARILEWMVTSFSRGSFQPRERIRVSCVCCIASVLLTAEPPGVAIKQTEGVTLWVSVYLCFPVQMHYDLLWRVWIARRGLSSLIWIDADLSAMPQVKSQVFISHMNFNIAVDCTCIRSNMIVQDLLQVRKHAN